MKTRAYLVMVGVVLSMCLIFPAEVAAQSVPVKLDDLIAKIDKLQAALDALKTPPPKSTTDLLFPFAVNVLGLDTSIAIANTLDGSGGCTLNFFGTNAPAPADTLTIASGKVYTLVLSGVAPGFEGFILVHCNFPRARGWGFVSDVGLRAFATTVDAEILP